MQEVLLAGTAVVSKCDLGTIGPPCYCLLSSSLFVRRGVGDCRRQKFAIVFIRFDFAFDQNRRGSASIALKHEHMIQVCRRTTDGLLYLALVSRGKGQQLQSRLRAADSYKGLRASMQSRNSALLLVV